MKKMSSDRNLKLRQLLSFPDAQKLIVKTVEERKIVRVGDWFLFQTLSGSKRDYLFLLGRVLQFMSESKKKTQLEWQRGTDLGTDKKVDEDIAVICTWYQFDGQTDKSKEMSTTGTKLSVIAHGFHPCNTYICSLPPPTIPSCKNSENIVHDASLFLSRIK